MIKAGTLRHRVTVQALVIDIDSDGAQVEAWADVFGAPLSASIAPLSGRELIAAQAVQSQISTRIIVRHRPGFKAAQRVLHRGTIYNIEAVVPDPASGHRWCSLMCTSGVNEG